ncbi:MULTISPECIES: RHS repeat-associated core domain-containing protein [unclassified Pseudomonas]|uniref:RHS repeat-associated core domain-containing protein n=1 Tax=unclassified Pseudomonas TaxID=196821 RepID=UPI002115354F|nr:MULTISPECIES: RHS repeat-associated core domain-containing protein [unclassified Pseudomonas]
MLNTLNANQPRQPIAYTPYGHRDTASGLLSRLGFNGERPEPVTGCYLLGIGYRAFNPVLMRFIKPDSWSPFGKGGLNPYAYCLGDPINRYDPNGHLSFRMVVKLAKWRDQAIAWSATKAKAGDKYNKALTASSEATQHKQYKVLDWLENFYPHEKRMKDHRSLKMPRDIQIKKISSLDDFRKIPDEKAMESLSRTEYEVRFNQKRQLNFIYTSKRKLFVSSTRHQYLSDMTGSPYVISAGEITKIGSESAKITNGSGHFHPSFDSLTPVKEHLEELGIRVSTVRSL